MRRLRLILVGAAVCSAAALALFGTPAHASPQTPHVAPPKGVRVTAADVQSPDGPVTAGNEFTSSLACSGRGRCYSTGGDENGNSYFDASHNGTWKSIVTNGHARTVPANGLIACPAKGACYSLSGSTEAILSAATATTHHLAGALDWQGIACAAAGHCVAFGPAPGHTWPSFAQLTGTGSHDITGGTIAKARPADPMTTTQLVCPSVSFCAQWSSYQTSTGKNLAYLQTLTGSTVRIATVPAPAGVTARVTRLFALRCAPSRNCVGYGDYSTDAKTFHELRLVLKDGRLSSTTVPVSASTAKALGVHRFGHVACAGINTCVAVTTLYDHSSRARGVVSTLQSGEWTSRVVSSATVGINYEAIGCPVSNYCVIAGYRYSTDRGGYPTPHAIVVFDLAGRLSTVGPPGQPGDAGATTQAGDIACAPGTRTCTIAAADVTPSSFEAYHLDVTG